MFRYGSYAVELIAVIGGIGILFPRRHYFKSSIIACVDRWSLGCGGSPGRRDTTGNLVICRGERLSGAIHDIAVKESQPGYARRQVGLARDDYAGRR